MVLNKQTKQLEEQLTNNEEQQLIILIGNRSVTRLGYKKHLREAVSQK